MNPLLSSPGLVWSVAELNRSVKTLIEREIPLVWVAGEISNLTIAASGHCYFSLKDAQAQVRCVMFRNRAMLLPFKPREGMKVEARAQVTLYEARGDFQLNLEAMRPAGLGALYEAFELLKQRLAAEGLFDAARKRPLPLQPRAIGIVTSPQAAALRDVIATLRRRAPHLPVVLYPTPVQGEGAAQQIARRIAEANARKEVDVLLVCRGGGSIEDLWSFNEEVVARAIAGSQLPVVSGVGHETDFTIADFVADLRAPTPTAAAELVSPDRSAQLARLAELARRSGWLLRQALERRMQKLDLLASRLLHPGERIARQRERLAGVAVRRDQAYARGLERARWRLEGMQLRISRQRPDPAALGALLVARRARLQELHGRQQQLRQRSLAALVDRLEGLNPEAVLARGYSMVTSRDGKVISDAATLKAGQVVSMRFAKGEARAVIDSAGAEQGKLF
ncbi:exodeoxyribonuclease VII large subunit [Chitinimonas sp. BJYL2]|uniref:exodeoxyribonuclease VII large subunit n=1 Tax=Chitinimonas sp. BJYL2 TaxID=2976696 RepID=UPI0022B2E045|nr:exodeoxyribonuclease VII large subunit [Chitinimonas sp. BJYL2]